MNAQPGIPGYVTIKGAAGMLDLSAGRVYEYVKDGRLSSVWAGRTLLIPLEEVQQFTPKIAGRPRKSVLRWHISPENNALLVTSIVVAVKPGARGLLMRRLEEIRRSEQYLFPGTVARFIMRSEACPDHVEISLLWRLTVMPDETVRECAIAAFRESLADVLEWETARYSQGQVLMHT